MEGLLDGLQENIPGEAVAAPIGRIPNAGFVEERVSELIYKVGARGLQVDSMNIEISQVLQFPRLADAVVIGVDPEQELAIHGVAGIDEAVAVPPFSGASNTASALKPFLVCPFASFG